MHRKEDDRPASRPVDTADQAPNQSIPYTRFSLTRRRYIVVLLGYVTLASSLTATIYFPVIELLADEYDASIQAINLTITLYVVFQGVAPALFAPMSDTLGRRPVLLFSFLIYVGASLGLAFNSAQRRYAALLVLRGLQSLGGSAVLGLAYGVVADIVTPAERGSMLGPLLMTTNLGPCVGPVFGGLIAQETGSSEWIFWTLTIFGVVALALIALTLPETSRNVVGNGAVEARGIWRAGWDMMSRSRPACLVSKEGELQGAQVPEPSIPAGKERQSAGNDGKTGKGSLQLPDLVGPVRVIFYRDTGLILWVAASVYTAWYCIQTSIPIVFGTLYSWNQLHVGLSYLVGGSGVILGGFAGGKMMDANYKFVAKNAGLQIDRVAGDDMRLFPIEKARSRGSLTLFLFSAIALSGLGWSIRYRAHPSVPLVLQFLIGAQGTITHQSFNALLVDIFPSRPSTAAAAGNITRCAMSAAAVACINPLVRAVGYGWLFTLLGFLSASTGIAAILTLRKWGRGWREKRQSGAACHRADVV